MKEGKSIDLVNIKRIIKEYYEQLCAHKVDNLDEINQFLERYNLSIFTQEEIDSMNWNKSVKEIALGQGLEKKRLSELIAREHFASIPINCSCRESERKKNRKIKETSYQKVN